MFFRISFLLLSVVSSLAIAADEAEIVSFTAVTISIDEEGNGKFTVDTRPVEEAHKVNEPLGQPVAIKAMEPASVYKLNDGRLHLRYDFSKIKSLDTLKSPVLNEDEEKLFSELRIDSDEGLLVLSQNQMPRSSFNLPRSVSGSFNVRVLLAGLSEGMIKLMLSFNKDILAFGLHGENSADKERGIGTVYLSLRQNDNWKELVQKIQPPNSRDETSFKITSELMTQRILIRLGRIGNVPLGVPMIDVVANFPPSFGIKLSQKGSKVIAERIISDSGAEKAGLKQGDVLISINGQEAKDVDTSMSLLGKSPIDRDTELEIERFGKRRTIQVLPQ